ncbi:MAG: DnaJ domain-containing protein [Deltaproteobacteria bacterium]|nr:DnaJ domain-containing protein [Deltaproteobacteria bacterium]
MQFVDYYEVLGIDRSASPDDVKKAFRKLSKKFHPDINRAKDAKAKFQQVNEAYEVLKDADKRRRYDQLGRNYHAGDDFRAPQGWQGVEFNFDGGGAPFGGRGGGVPSGFSDFFEAFFGGTAASAGPRARRAPYSTGFDFEEGPRKRRGDDQEAELTVSLEDAYQGATKTIALQQGVTGADGGHRVEERSFQVKIPPGTTDGMRIRLAGQGGRGLGGAAAGDLLLKVSIAPHPRFTVEGHDLVAVLPVTPWEALFGGKIPFRTLDGEIQLKIPEGSQGGQKLRLKDKGLPKKGGERGHLTVELRVVVPQKPTAEERKLFEELARVSQFNPRSDPRA